MQTEPLFSLIERLRPAPARVLSLDPRWNGGPSWQQKGYEVIATSPSSPLASNSADVLIAGREALGKEMPAGLDRLRSALSPQGILILQVKVAQDADSSAPELIASLYERGLSPLERCVLDCGNEPDAPPSSRPEGPFRWEIVVAGRIEHRVRGFRPGDERAILNLFHEAFPHDRRSPAHWAWKYRDHPGGGPYLSLAVDPSDRIGAHYAGYPVPFVDATGATLRRFSAFQIGDTMTARWAQGVGRGRSTLLALATQHFFNRHCARRIGFNFGFNTGKIHRYYLRLVPGSEYLEPVPYRVLELGIGRSGERAWRWAWKARGLVVERVDAAAAVDDAWDRLLNTAAATYRLLASRDAGHLRWRYFGRPDASYLMLAVRRWGRLVGWGVFRREAERLIWGDALFLPGYARHGSALLAAALAQPETAGVTRVEGWFPERPAFWDQTLREMGFERREEPRRLALIYMEFEERDLARRFARYLYYTLGDSDLF